MCARNNSRTRWLLLLLALPFWATSCTSDESTTSSNDYCYIKSVTLGTIVRTVERRDRKDRTIVISRSSTTFSGNTFAMTINQRDNTIENRDSLPYGSRLSAVLATISFDGSMIKYREKGSNAGWTAYNSTDSLDLTKPLELYLTSNDELSSRTYYLKVNVHKQEGDSLYWDQCEEEVEVLKEMTDMKAFALDDKLMVLGRKATGIVLAIRSGIESQGTWESEQTTNLPAEVDLQTLRQQNDQFYISTSDGKILSSTDARDWQQIGTSYSSGLTLVEKTEDYFYAVTTSEGKMLCSADAITWEEEELDTESMLPVSDITALTLQQANGSLRIVMVGQREESTNCVVWNKMWNEGWKSHENDAEWIYFPITPDNQIPCPRLKYLNLLRYDGKCIIFGGASQDGSRKALDAMYVSQDYGITWRPSSMHHMPIQLEGIEGCITSIVDKNNYIWIITNAQVWRGRLNRLGFAQQ